VLFLIFLLPWQHRNLTVDVRAGSRSNVTVNLTLEKRTPPLHESIVNERKALRVSSPDFNVIVGAQVPRTVRFAASSVDDRGNRTRMAALNISWGSNRDRRCENDGDSGDSRRVATTLLAALSRADPPSEATRLNLARVFEKIADTQRLGRCHPDAAGLRGIAERIFGPTEVT
jgi:hypothetical protein